ncbi:hypothetical protein [Burkholderia pseudomallei]|jgi:hypothetical protein|uniref:hypothetical protein n=1 Tax=Burkholderia pseudomallei TaxID=28450 RepID=UPI0024DF8CD3|nr:hypothetical protein [Burkholderia pseudomallei]
MTGEQFVELWFGSLFCGWDFLGENTALTYFLVGAAIGAILCNNIFCKGYIEDVDALGAGIIYVAIFSLSTLFWGLLPAVVIPIYVLVVLLATINDQIGKSRTDVRRKK